VIRQRWVDQPLAAGDLLEVRCMCWKITGSDSTAMISLSPSVSQIKRQLDIDALSSGHP